MRRDIEDIKKRAQSAINKAQPPQLNPASTEPISRSILSTCSFAPPCSGPYSAATAAAAAEYGSTCELPTARIAFVEQFCSWSACRMNRTSSACSRTGSGS